MSIADRNNLESIEPEPEPCGFCSRDMNRVGSICVCNCVEDVHGNVIEDCGACSSGTICQDCYDQMRGVELRVLDDTG